MTTDAQKRLLVVLFSLGAGALLVGALGDRVYAYYNYTLLRWVVCFSAVLVCVLALRWRQLWAVGIFGFIAILFNPVAVINLSPKLWRLIDVVAAGMFVLAAATVEPPGEGTVRRLAGLPSRLLAKNVPSGVVIVMATALVLGPLGVVIYRMDLVSVYRWEKLHQTAEATQRAFNAVPDVDRLGIRFGQVGDSVDNKELTLEQRTEYQAVAGRLAVQAVQRLQADPSYGHKSDADKEKAIRNAVEYAREKARQELKLEAPSQGQLPTSSTEPSPSIAPQGRPTAGSSSYDMNSLMR